MRSTASFRFLGLFLLLVGPLCLGPEALAAPLIASPNDTRQYDGFTLENKLRVLIISDPNTQKGAAALDVMVGSSSDPDSREGLSHFLEHMLFLGTEKYPEAGEYQRFITTHGGRYNAYTAFENTTYFFDVAKDSLEPALDRFAQFFIAPLFTAEYVTRERQAVHSEFRSKLKDDGWRNLDAHKRVFNPRHPFSRFSNGNLTTLADRGTGSIRDELMAFYQTHYSANLMSLVVLGREPLPVLRQWVTNHFSAVPNSNVPAKRSVEPLFRPETLPARLNIIPAKNQPSLSLVFPIPPVTAHYRSKPTEFVASLLGHEGEASLLSLLKRKSLATALVATTGLKHRGEATFNVNIALTTRGLDHISDIVAYVFQYLRLIEHQGITPWRFQEQRDLANLQFRFQEVGEPHDYVQRLAGRMQLYPFNDILRAPYAMDYFDPTVLRRYLEHLTPENVLVTVRSQKLQAAETSSWFKVPYQLTPLSDVTVAQWKEQLIVPDLDLPEPNVFVPKNLALKPLRDVTSKPAIVYRQEGLEFWHQQDEIFRVPRADVFFTIRSPRANDSARHAALTRLYVELVKDAVQEFSYPALVAGLDYRLYPHLRGFSVRISGYNDKQDLLLSSIIQTLVGLNVDPVRFAVARESLVRRITSEKKESPFTQAMTEVGHLLLEPHWRDTELLAALNDVSLSELEQFIPQLLDRLSVVGLAHGNLYREEAVALGQLLGKKFFRSALPVNVPNGNVVKLAKGDKFVRELAVSHPDSAVAVYFQGADRSHSSRAYFSLLKQVVAAPLYHDLRTERQLGYVVFSALMTLFDAPGIGFIVQSPSSHPVMLQTHIERFISEYAGTLASMTDEDFEQHKAGLLTKVLRSEKRLGERSARYWSEINREQYSFNSNEAVAKEIKRISKTSFQTFYTDFTSPKNRKQLIVRSLGTEHGTNPAHPAEASQVILRDKDILIENPRTFARDKKYFSSAREELPGKTSTQGSGRG